ncbi:hypothetical protein KC968_02810 [Candidatus Saccharibacteria bacterium]|nr:hypothetical protein [Candidatus Saccharibacteria bacterium]
MLKKIINGLSAGKDLQRKADLYRKLLRHEARIGGEVFGPVRPGGRREFFCLDEHTWVWHEEWIDQNGQHQYATTRYDVRPNGLVKSQNGQYKPVSDQEARNLLNAAELYKQRVNSELYSFVA